MHRKRMFFQSGDHYHLYLAMFDLSCHGCKSNRRAWFPKRYPPSKRWAHTEGRSFSGYGQQVWCKCNFTASYIVPWPVPPDADWMSWVTLDTLHGALERFGPIPKNPRFRKLDKQDRPSWKGAISEHERHARGGKYHEGIP